MLSFMTSSTFNLKAVFQSMGLLSASHIVDLKPPFSWACVTKSPSFMQIRKTTLRALLPPVQV